MLALIKLQNGQELIGLVTSESKTELVVEDPLQINYRLVATQPMPMVSISRYMPFSNSNIFEFDKRDLLHVVEPKQAMVAYYTNALDNYREVIDDNVEQELIYASSIDDGEAGEEDYTALLERLEPKGPLN